MVEYERAHDTSLDLSEFSWVAKNLILPEMKDWAQEILDERTRLWENKGLPAKEPKEAEALQEQQDQYYGVSNGKAA